MCIREYSLGMSSKIDSRYICQNDFFPTHGHWHHDNDLCTSRLQEKKTVNLVLSGDIRSRAYRLYEKRACNCIVTAQSAKF